VNLTVKSAGSILFLGVRECEEAVDEFPELVLGDSRGQ